MGFAIVAVMLLGTGLSPTCAQGSGSEEECTLPYTPTPAGAVRATDAAILDATAAAPTAAPQPSQVPAEAPPPIEPISQPTPEPVPTGTRAPELAPPTATPAPTGTLPPEVAPSTPEPVPTGTRAPELAPPTPEPVPTGTRAPELAPPTPEPAPTGTLPPEVAPPTPEPAPTGTLPPEVAPPTATPAPTGTLPPEVAPPTATPDGPGREEPQPQPTATPAQIVSADEAVRPPAVAPSPTALPTAIATSRAIAPTRQVRPTLTATSASARPARAITITTGMGNRAPDAAAPVIESTGYESMLQISSPAGLVFTTSRQDNADGTFTLIACVANVGRQPASVIDIAFALDTTSATITSLRAPSAPGEVSARQARAIIGQLPAGYQTQVEATIRAREGFSEAHYRVMVPQAYRLTNLDPKLRCQAQGSGAALPELVKAEFTVGGESVDARAAAEALRSASLARPIAAGSMLFTSGAPGISVPASGLTAVLILIAAFILGLGLLTLFARRE